MFSALLPLVVSLSAPELGVRCNALEGAIDFDPPALATVAQDESWLDLFVGARAECEVTEDSDGSLRLDVGGFDLGESCDFAWNAQALVGWQFGERWTLAAGYRVLDVEYDQAASTTTSARTAP